MQTDGFHVRWRLVVGLALTFTALAVGGAVAATLTPAEKELKRSFAKSIPVVVKASNAVIKGAGEASGDSDAQAANVFSALAVQWASATKPLSSLKGPPGTDTKLLSAITHYAGAVEADLLTVSKDVRQHHDSAASNASLQLAHDFNTFGVWFGELRKRLGL